MGLAALRHLRRPLRLLLSAIAVAPLFAAALEAHTGPTPHDGETTSRWMSPEAQHPGQPLHLEAAHAVRAPGCPACVLQAQGACDGVATPPALGAPTVGGAVVRPVAVALRLGSHHASASRGPPST